MATRICDARRPGWAVLWLVALLALAPAAPASAEDRPGEIPNRAPAALPSLDPEYRMTSHKVVLITDQGVNPRVATLDEGQLVAWISYSPHASVVVFEREVARSMICHSLVNFSIQADELRSAPIHAGEFASFCQLKPGRYRYQVVRPDAQGAEHRAGTDRIEGEIIVGNPSGGG